MASLEILLSFTIMQGAQDEPPNAVGLVLNLKSLESRNHLGPALDFQLIRPNLTSACIEDFYACLLALQSTFCRF